MIKKDKLKLGSFELHTINLLRDIRGLQDVERRLIYVKELAELKSVDPSSMSKKIKKLEEAEYIKVRKNPYLNKTEFCLSERGNLLIREYERYELLKEELEEICQQIKRILKVMYSKESGPKKK